jgi:hypothetical protein
VSSGRFEVWFMPDDTVSVVVETDAGTDPTPEGEVLETAVFVALAAGTIANLPKHVRTPLCSWLADFELPADRDDIPTSVGDRILVLPSSEGERRGFTGTMTMKGAMPSARMKTHGFGLFGSSVQDYAQEAVQAVMLYLLLGFSPYARAMIVQAAHTLGNLGLAGAVRMTTHPQAAMTALEAGVEAFGQGER